MKGTIYLVRHGKHEANVLTPQGIEDARQAGKVIKIDLAEIRRGRFVYPHLISSEEPRAVQTMAIIAAILGKRLNIQPSFEFNPARGLGEAIKAGKLPPVGQGFAAAWRDNGCDDVESWNRVQRRGRCELQTFINSTLSLLVVVCHGGVIEPIIDGLEGADCHDMAEGEVAVMEIEDYSLERARVRFINRPSTPPTSAELLDESHR